MVARRRSPLAGRRRNLLIELGTEELPPGSLASLGRSFARSVYESLSEAGVVEAGRDAWRWFATPRRLVVWLGQVSPRQPDRVEERRGPSVKAAFDDSGTPTRAALGFAGSCGVDVGKLERLTTDQGAWLVYRHKVSGERIQVLVEHALDQSIRKLPIARRMRWGDREQEFVRPVHWLLAMYGSEALKVSTLGLDAEPWTRGHRFHSRGRIRILSADRYLDTLKKDGFVVADLAERRNLIERQVNRLARRNGGTAVIDPSLLDEVTGLVEWPRALYGEFDRRFLKVPPEVLVSSMRDHQKYFHLVDDRGRLLPGFITVSNIRSSSPKRVRTGNERVLRARLADAEFFWEGDRKIPLAQRRPQLDRVLFHERLGSIGDKVERMRGLALDIAGQTGADPDATSRACDLAKADLVTDMVGEFPELQGTIGSYYAAHDGEPAKVSAAIREHYQPRYAGDSLPTGSCGICLALADRIDTLTGIFACGEAPSGDKDPYALRRAALGVLRILIEGEVDLDLRKLVVRGMERHGSRDGLDTGGDAVSQVYGFITDRLRAYYQALDYDALEIAAVAAVDPASPLDFHQRLVALRKFVRDDPESAQSLASANKRIANILARQKVDIDTRVDESLLQEKAEQNLYRKVSRAVDKAEKHLSAGKYARGLAELSRLKKPVDTFFDKVMVMDDDPDIRNNRLALLMRIRHLFLAVADISLIRVE
jgi:glycyl-tRNA synthetase beta chain